MVKGSVKVMQVQVNPKGVLFKRPQLDNGQLIKEKGLTNQLEIWGNEFQVKIEEIRAMTRHARDSRGENMSVTDTDTDDDIELFISVASDEECETDLHYIIPKSLRPEVSNEKEVSAFSDLYILMVQEIQNFLPKKLSIIKSAKEARESLSRGEPKR